MLFSKVHEVWRFFVQVKILTELHWSLPHPLTAAEAQLRSQELPSMSTEIDQLQIAFKVFPHSCAAKVFKLQEDCGIFVKL